MTGTPADAFWEFALAVYGRPGVAECCIAMQDNHGADVNLLLFLLYCGHGGIAATAGDVAEAEAAIGEWRRVVVEPLRAVRRALKAPPGRADAGAAAALRRDVAAAELAAERVAQGLLTPLLATMARPPDASPSIAGGVAERSTRSRGAPEGCASAACSTGHSAGG